MIVFTFQFGVSCLFLLIFILLRISTIVAFIYTEPDQIVVPTLYNYLRSASAFFKQVQFSVLVILIALPDEKVIAFMEKLGLSTVRSESNLGLLNLSSPAEGDTMTATRMTNRMTTKRMTITATETSPTLKTMNGDPSLRPTGVSNSFGTQRIDHLTTDEAFKANYSPDILSRKSTLTLKTSFHLINVTLMALCKVFQIIEQKAKENEKVLDERPIG